MRKLLMLLCIQPLHFAHNINTFRILRKLQTTSKFGSPFGGFVRIRITDFISAAYAAPGLVITDMVFISSELS